MMTDTSAPATGSAPHHVLSEAEAAAVGRGVPDPGLPLPRVAWPTLALGVGSVAVWVGTGALVLAGGSPWWLLLTVPVNAVVTFSMYIVMHEAAHHAAGRARWVNELVGRLAVPFVGAWGTFPVSRFIHIEHHRNTNAGDRDPDVWVERGPSWQLPLRWLLTDAQYTAFYLRSIPSRPRREVAGLATAVVVTAAAIAALVAGGYGLALVLIYLIPQRLGVGLISWWFGWLPHHDLGVDAHENRFRATRMRVGWERFLTPVMLYQNYHLVHHIHPAIPFYRYIHAWENRVDDYLARDVPLVTAWGTTLTPSEYRAWRGITGAYTPSTTGRSFHRLRVAEVRPLTADAVAVTFTVPAELAGVFDHAAGQHVTLRARVGGEFLRRSYSVCSAAGSGVLRVGIRRVDRGRFSTWANELSAGDTVEVSPPAGRFTPEPAAEGRRVVAVAAGSGITPILSIVASTLEAEPTSEALLVCANRDAASTMFAAEVSMLVSTFEGRLRVAHQHSRADGDPVDTRPAHAVRHETVAHGRLDATRLDALVEHPGDVDAWFLCGPEAMTDDLVEALARRGVRADRVHRELFTTPVGAGDEGTEGTEAAVSVVLDGDVHALETPGDEPLLETALRSGLDAPFSCAGGSCGTCVATLRTGTVHMSVRHALTDAEVAAGRILTCQARPTSAAVTVDYDDRAGT